MLKSEGKIFPPLSEILSWTTRDTSCQITYYLRQLYSRSVNSPIDIAILARLECKSPLLASVSVCSTCGCCRFIGWRIPSEPTPELLPKGAWKPEFEAKRSPPLLSPVKNRILYCTHSYSEDVARLATKRQ